MPVQPTVTPDRVGKIAAKVASETAYVLMGLADVVVGTMKDVASATKQHAADRRASGDPTTVRGFAKAVPGQLRSFSDEVVDAYKSLSDRGRQVMSDGLASTAHRPAPAPRYEQPDMSGPREDPFDQNPTDAPPAS